MLLSGVGHHVQCRHHQAGTVSDDSDLPVEFDVVQIVLLRLQFQRIGGVGILECGVVGVPEIGITVQGDLAVEGKNLIIGCSHERVDLDQGGVLGDEHLPELGDGHRRGVEHLGRQVALFGDRPGECEVDPGDSVDGHLGEAFRLGRGHLLDFDATLHRAHRQIGAVGPIEQEGEVVLLGDVAGLGDKQLLHDVALDVQAQNVLGVGVGVLGCGGILHATGLTTSTRFDLGLYHHRPADLLGDGLGALGRLGDPSRRGGDVVFGVQLLGLVLEKVHRLHCLSARVSKRFGRNCIYSPAARTTHPPQPIPPG